MAILTADVLKIFGYVSSLVPHIKVVKYKCFLGVKGLELGLCTAVKKLDMSQVWAKKKSDLGLSCLLCEHSLRDPPE